MDDARSWCQKNLKSFYFKKDKTHLPSSIGNLYVMIQVYTMIMLDTISHGRTLVGVASFYLDTHAIEQSFIALSLLPSVWPYEVMCLANYTGKW